MSLNKKTSEAVALGHPDKVADYISDSILDNILMHDENARVAVETMVSKNIIILAGEVTTSAKINYKKIALNAVREIGYSNLTKGFDPKKIKVIVKIKKQSQDIAAGVDKEDQGAGDQGIMFGYATDETEEFLPLPFVLAHKILKLLRQKMISKEIDFILPDAKAQVTMENNLKTISDIVLSVNHLDTVSTEELRKILKEEVIKKAVPENMLTDKTNYWINYTGRFVIGGPYGDCGLTGRKIIVDTYGGFASHGGGAFSGKDSTKVDRSAAYMARYIAKNIVHKKLAKKCEVMFAFAIGYHLPITFRINTFSTGNIPDEKLSEIINKRLKLTPGFITKFLDLRKPIYRKTVSEGHFFGDFSWEKTDLFDKFPLEDNN